MRALKRFVYFVIAGLSSLACRVVDPSRLNQITIDGAGQASQVFALEGKPDYQGRIIWQQCGPEMTVEACQKSATKVESSVAFMEFRGALVDVLLERSPDRVADDYSEILGAIIATDDKTDCPQGVGLPSHLKICKSQVYEANDPKFGWIKEAFEVAKKMEDERGSSGSGSQSTSSKTSTSTDISDNTDQGAQECPTALAKSCQNFVKSHGFIKAKNGKLVNEKGQPIRLWGMSLFWSKYPEGEKFWNHGVVATLKKDWNATMVRAAMQVDQDGQGYKNDKNEKNKVIKIVEAAVKEGIYVLVDFHTYFLNKPEAEEFFTEMAKLYNDVPNVIFEIYNEPNGDPSKGPVPEWSKDVKPYSENIIRKIRAQGANNLVLVGTKSWSSHPDEAASDPVTDPNVAYVLHFYAASHGKEFRDKANRAMSQGKAVFVSEFGTCEASGNGRFDPDETTRWIDFMQENMVSWANWSISDKAETCSALKQGANAEGNWPDDQLQESGLWIRGRLREQSL